MRCWRQRASTKDTCRAWSRGTEAAGTLREALARRWGITGRPVIAGGGGDNAASACGVGALAPGTGFLSFGTSGVLFVATGRFAPNTDEAVHAFCHAVPGTWHQMGVILSATDSLNWLSRITGKSPADLATAAESVQTDILFHPYLSGERTPHGNAGARGAFVGLSQSSGPAEMARAVLEGVAFAFADCAAALRAAGTEIGPVFAIGGGARATHWLQITADATGLTLNLPAKGDFGAALGAARLGLIAATGADPISVCTAPDTDRTLQPSDTDYSEKLARYRALYPPLNT